MFTYFVMIYSFSMHFHDYDVFAVLSGVFVQFGMDTGRDTHHIYAQHTYE